MKLKRLVKTKVSKAHDKTPGVSWILVVQKRMKNVIEGRRLWGPMVPIPLAIGPSCWKSFIFSLIPSLELLVGPNQGWILAFRGPQASSPKETPKQIVEGSFGKLHIIFALFWKAYNLFQSLLIMALECFISFLAKQCKDQVRNFRRGPTPSLKKGSPKRPPRSPPVISTAGPSQLTKAYQLLAHAKIPSPWILIFVNKNWILLSCLHFICWNYIFIATMQAPKVWEKLTEYLIIVP